MRERQYYVLSRSYIKARTIFSGNRAEESFMCKNCIDHDGAF